MHSSLAPSLQRSTVVEHWSVWYCIPTQECGNEEDSDLSVSAVVREFNVSRATVIGIRDVA